MPASFRGPDLSIPGVGGGVRNGAEGWSGPGEKKEGDIGGADGRNGSDGARPLFSTKRFKAVTVLGSRAAQ
ncbi:hypothetical protein D9M69_598450 [compost metagenome]